MRAAVDDNAYVALRACGKQGFNLHSLLFTPAHAHAASICAGLGPADVQAAMAIAGVIAKSAAIVGSGVGVFVAGMLVPTNSDQRATITGTASDGAQVTFGGVGSETARTMKVRLENGEELRFAFTQTGAGHAVLTGASRHGADGITQTLGGQEAYNAAGRYAGAVGATIVASKSSEPDHRPGMGHNGGPPLDDAVGTGAKPPGKTPPDPKAPKPLVPPPVQGYDVDYGKVSTAKPGQPTAPRTLQEQLLWNQVLSNPAGGKALKGLVGDRRFPAVNGWQKMHASHQMPGGGSIVIHYQYNSITGKPYDMKFK